ncbi:PstA family ABC transporter permease [Desulfatiferula olefinivorans]
MIRRVMERLFAGFAWVSGGILIASVGCLLTYLLVKGWPALGLDLVFGSVPPLDALTARRQVFDGLFPAVAGTTCLVLVSVSMALPLGLAAGIYMAEFAPAGVKKTFGLFYDILSGVPSIVVGLFGFSITIVLHRHLSASIFPCLMISACSLAFLVLPYLIRSTQVSLENLSPDVRSTALALGATPIQNLRFVLIPRCLSGIMSGVVLSIGRCAEDTAVIMLTGVVATAGLPRSLWSHYEALPFYIYYVSSQYGDQQELARGYGASILLLCVCLTLFAVSFIIKDRLGRRARISL